MSSRKVVLVSAGLSQPSSTRLLGDLLGAAVSRAVGATGDEVLLDVVELREHAHDLTDNLLTGFGGEDLRTVLTAVAQTDALIAVTPVFSGSYSGLFKMFFDVLEEGALVGTPVIIAATAGTARHSLALDFALRPLFAYLRAVVVPTGVFAASAAGSGAASAAGSGAASAAGPGAASGASGTGSTASGTGSADPFADVTPFAQLLAGGR